MGRATESRGNLPGELTSFVGRRRQLQEVKSALTAARLVTLVGPGGVGKTRLGLRSATDLRRGIPDGVWLVELAGLRDGELVTKAVMTSLGLRDELSRWPVSRLIEYVASKRVLPPPWAIATGSSFYLSASCWPQWDRCCSVRSLTPRG